MERVRGNGSRKSKGVEEREERRVGERGGGWGRGGIRSGEYGYIYNVEQSSKINQIGSQN